MLRQTTILLLLLLFVTCLQGQSFSFIRASEHFTLGTAAGLANTLAAQASSSRAIEFNTAMDFGFTTVNLVLVGKNFKGWRNKTSKQKRNAFINSAAYIGIGLGARQLTIKYSTEFSHK